MTLIGIAANPPAPHPASPRKRGEESRGTYGAFFAGYETIEARTYGDAQVVFARERRGEGQFERSGELSPRLVKILLKPLESILDHRHGAQLVDRIRHAMIF